MPTFKFIKENREVTELTGASPPRLSQLVSRFAGPIPAAVPAAASSSSSSSTTSVPAPPAPKPAEAAKPTDQSLLAYITSKDLVCLNQSNDHPLSSILGSNAGPKGSSYLESDVDAELLISISFNEAVKIRAISLFSGVSPGQAPKDVKLFINVPVMDFTTAESMNPAQELVLTPDQVSGEKIELRYVRFQNVRNLHILVKSNQEDEETTRIDSIDLFGTVGATTDKGPLKKIGTNED
ncbi:thioredoxin [Tremella mesenterica]|uniref:Thioredoxin n=1 Tax=Tremella mesenterica TaxID=5217 RepID=A0A4Q1BVM1_TREME|nr:thioredoxin [Tremella mesenterica]